MTPENVLKILKLPCAHVHIHTCVFLCVPVLLHYLN